MKSKTASNNNLEEDDALITNQFPKSNNDVFWAELLAASIPDPETERKIRQSMEERIELDVMTKFRKVNYKNVASVLFGILIFSILLLILQPFQKTIIPASSKTSTLSKKEISYQKESFYQTKKSLLFATVKSPEVSPNEQYVAQSSNIKIRECTPKSNNQNLATIQSSSQSPILPNFSFCKTFKERLPSPLSLIDSLEISKDVQFFDKDFSCTSLFYQTNLNICLKE